MYPHSNDLSAWNFVHSQEQYPPPFPGPGMGSAYPPYAPPGPGYPPIPQTYPQMPYPVSQPAYPAVQPGYPPTQPTYQPPLATNPAPGYSSGYPTSFTAPYQPQPQQGSTSVHPGQPSVYNVANGTPTLRPYSMFNAEQDSAVLRKAMKGLGTDEKAIIQVFSNRTASQRVQIVKQFKTMYGKDLISELKSELSGRFEDIVVAMCYTLEEFDAIELRKAMEGLGTNEDTLIEILASRTNTQIRNIRECFKRLFNRDLEKDLISETSGHFRRVLISLAQGNRDESTQVNLAVAQADAQALYNAGEKRWGTDESVFNYILASKSEAHVRAVIGAYKSVGRRDFVQAIKSETSGDLQKSLLAITGCIQNKARFFAEELKNSMQGAGTRDRKLIRIVVSRCEVDMGDIKREFQTAFGKSLESWISDDTSGDYRRMLLALVADHR